MNCCFFEIEHEIELYQVKIITVTNQEWKRIIFKKVFRIFLPRASAGRIPIILGVPNRRWNKFKKPSRYNSNGPCNFKTIYSINISNKLEAKTELQVLLQIESVNFLKKNHTKRDYKITPTHWHLLILQFWIWRQKWERNGIGQVSHKKDHEFVDALGKNLAPKKSVSISIFFHFLKRASLISSYIFPQRAVAKK